jgi:hypothetical protein
MARELATMVSYDKFFQGQQASPGLDKIATLLDVCVQ